MKGTLSWNSQELSIMDVSQCMQRYAVITTSSVAATMLFVTKALVTALGFTPPLSLVRSEQSLKTQDNYCQLRFPYISLVLFVLCPRRVVTVI